jgi:hypothetical protein
MATVTVQTTNGPRDIPAVWCGAHLAVHCPVRADEPGGVSREGCLWRVSHLATGYGASRELRLPKYRAVALAKLWDVSFADITEAGHAKGWPWGERWADDLRRAEAGRDLIGPRELTPLERLETAGTAAEVQSAVVAARGYETAAEPEASEQFPAAVTKQTTGAGAVRRNPDSAELELWWLPRGGNYSDADAFSLAGWYPVPCLADVEAWALDSVAETPCGDAVEPDHPDAWPRLLGVV